MFFVIIQNNGIYRKNLWQTAMQVRLEIGKAYIRLRAFSCAHRRSLSSRQIIRNLSQKLRKE